MPNYRNVVQSQKRELDAILQAPYVDRDHQLPSLDHDLINVIIGPRRAGKSFFACHLLKDIDHFGYVNFDDERLIDLQDIDGLLAAVNGVYSNPRHLLLDEIQNLEHWQLILNRLQRLGYRLTVTGSNAHLLSEELATHLTGRHLPCVLLPFSFREYLRSKPVELTQEEQAASLDEYVEIGGYPEVVTGKLPQREYLSTLFDSIILKDVVRRYRVRYVQGLMDLSKHLMSSLAAEYSYRRLSTVVGNRNVHTIQNYMRFLETAFLFFSVPRFSTKVRLQKRYNKKLYSIDNGLVTATGFRLSHKRGTLYENIVAIELHKRALNSNIELFFWKSDRGEEVDFVVKRGLKIFQLIQVCFETSQPKTKQREIRGLLNASKALKCDDLVILTHNEDLVEKASWYNLSETIRFIPLWKWLLEEHRW